MINRTLLLAILPILFFSGCSQVSVNSTMCDSVNLNEAQMHTMPEECRDYRKEDADNATYPGEKPVEVNREFDIGK